MSAYKVMLGQAGARSVIRWQEVGSRVIGTSHYSSMAEFIEEAVKRGRKLAWYEEVGRGKRVVIRPV